ncbi:MAG: hypothetical protein AAF936_02010 [Pseudomonadota bacterium]
MTHHKLTLFLAGMSAFALCGAANAQEDAAEVPEQNVENTGETAQNTSVQSEETIEEIVAEPSSDEMADLLNSQQQLQQTFTFRRTIDGKVVETEKRTVTYDPASPYRETEAGQTTVERLKTAFDGEVLTRTEAFEEAKLDFTIGDVNRDGVMTADEFAELVASWREVESRTGSAPNAEIARQRQYDAFLAEISPETAQMQYEAYAKEKFMFLTGGVETVSRKDYIREYLLDFDAMDADADTILKDDELLKFRALNSGETIEM